MDFTNFSFDPNVFGGAFLGAGLVALGIIALLIGIAVYVYFALAWKAIAEKVKYKNSWLAWIPFANISMWLQMGGFHWAWVFLLIIPVIGWLAVGVLFVISNWRVFEKLKYPGWWSLAPVLSIIPHLSGLGTLGYGIAVGVIAWGKKKR